MDVEDYMINITSLVMAIIMLRIIKCPKNFKAGTFSYIFTDSDRLLTRSGK